jgi:hypothetical protein
VWHQLLTAPLLCRAAAAAAAHFVADVSLLLLLPLLLAGGKDRLADPRDLELMLQVLPSRHILLHQHFPDYEHLDFIWGINAAHRVYTRVLDVLGALHNS